MINTGNLLKNYKKKNMSTIQSSNQVKFIIFILGVLRDFLGDFLIGLLSSVIVVEPRLNVDIAGG